VTCEAKRSSGAARPRQRLRPSEWNAERRCGTESWKVPQGRPRAGTSEPSLVAVGESAIGSAWKALFSRWTQPAYDVVELVGDLRGCLAASLGDVLRPVGRGEQRCRGEVDWSVSTTLAAPAEMPGR
jgi:hypothetical protein